MITHFLIFNYVNFIHVAYKANSVAYTDRLKNNPE